MKVQVESVYGLSPAQQGLLFHLLSEPESDVYLQQLRCAIQGPMDSGLLKRALQQIVDRYSALRTCFVWKTQAKPMQVVVAHADVPWHEEDWRGVLPAERPERLQEFLRQDRARNFVPRQAPLMRASVLRMEDDVWQFIWTHHHIILDGWSVALVLKEVFAEYEASRWNRDKPVAKPLPYRDYIVWLEKQDRAALQNYWRSALRGLSDATLLAEAHDGVSTDASKQECQRCLSAATTSVLKQFARQHSLTLSTVVHGAWAVLLSRYTGQHDIVFGTVSSGRPAELPEVESMVGLFINTLPVHVLVDPDASVVEWLKAVQIEQSQARQYEYGSLAEIKQWSSIPSKSPFFDTIVAIENYPIESSTLSSTELKIVDVSMYGRTNYPVSLLIHPGELLSMTLLYDETRLADGTAARILHSLEILLETISSGVSRIGALPVVSADERQQLIAWSGGQAGYENAGSVREWFERQAELRPDAIAIVCGDEQISYGELNCGANQLAHYLRDRAVRAEAIVGILLDRSAEMVSAILGILKARGAYLPLDVDYPPDRLRYMLKDAGVQVLITSSEYRTLVKGFSGEVVCLDEVKEKLAAEPVEVPTGFVDPESLMYVIYTSGSTGQPKGVMIPHGNVARLLRATENWFEFGPADIWSLFHSFAFDFSVWELWGALAYGGRLVVMPYWVTRSPESFCAELESQRVTVLNQTPSAFRALMEHESEIPPEWSAIRVVIFGGEALDPAMLRPWRERHGKTQLVNMYGITETTVHVTHRLISDEEIDARGPSPIGSPISDLQVYVLDAQQQLLPVGVVGELYVGGAGLARGYLHRGDLTAERFVPHPFSGSGGERLYRTGDLTRYRLDGSLEFAGRADHQIKVRGFRVELGEIESLLAQHPGVAQAVVVARPGFEGLTQLFAYLTIEDGLPAVRDLREYLSERVPDYMVPANFIFLPSMPLTYNGKIDRGALPSPENLQQDGESYEVPQNALEQLVADIWKEVLGVERIGRHDNFFDLGGHSLLVLRALALLRQRAQFQSVRILDVFEHPTVAALATFLKKETRGGSESQSEPMHMNHTALT